MISLRDHETTILDILGTEILGLFQIDLLSNFMLEMTAEHIPALLGSQFCGFLAFWKCLILKCRFFLKTKKPILWMLLLDDYSHISCGL